MTLASMTEEQRQELDNSGLDNQVNQTHYPTSNQ